MPALRLGMAPGMVPGGRRRVPDGRRRGPHWNMPVLRLGMAPWFGMAPARPKAADNA